MASFNSIRVVNGGELSHGEPQLSLFAGLDTIPRAVHTDVRTERRSITYVNHLQCTLIKDHLKLVGEWYKLADKFALNEKPRMDQIRTLIFLVSVCDRLNWDFVLGPLAHDLSEITNEFDPESVLALSPTDFRRAFGNYRRDDGTIKFSQSAAEAVAHFQCPGRNWCASDNHTNTRLRH